MIRMYAILYGTKDYGDVFVVRGWSVGPGVITPDEEPLAVTATLELARAAVPPGLNCQPRLPQEDPVIVETWL